MKRLLSTDCRVQCEIIPNICDVSRIILQDFCNILLLRVIRLEVKELSVALGLVSAQLERIRSGSKPAVCFPVTFEKIIRRYEPGPGGEPDVAWLLKRFG
jgi:hypothetical protein